MRRFKVKCDHCNGTGNNGNCDWCNGSGYTIVTTKTNDAEPIGAIKELPLHGE